MVPPGLSGKVASKGCGARPVSLLQATNNEALTIVKAANRPKLSHLRMYRGALVKG